MDVVLRRLGKRFDRDDVLTDLDLDLRAGQAVAVIGLNGAGKTTLLRCLAGIIAPTRGTIRWNGSDSLRDDMALHRQMMFLPDAPMLFEDRTILENLVTFLRAYGREAAVSNEEIVAVLRELDLLEHCASVVVRLSRGQRYKVLLAALLLIKPELWLLDEPFASGMDPQGMQTLKRHGHDAIGSGACLVYTTQIIEIAERFCDVLLVIDRGRLVQRFTREELRAMPEDGPGSLGERLAAFRGRTVTPTPRLDDPRRVRALTRACRRAAARTRARPWWRWGRRRASSATRDRAKQLATRLVLTGIVGASALIAVHPLTVQLLALAGVLVMLARIAKLRMLLGGDAALAVLAQFPITDRTIVRHQVRQRWRSALFATLDAAAFWSVYWQARQDSVPWHWVPLVAATHALVTEGLALLLLRVRIQGLLFAAAGATAMWGAIRQHEQGWLWGATEPVLQACAWLTPWGWSNTLAAQLLERPHLAAPLLALALIAAGGIAWAYRHLERTWALDPAWREIAGRPVHTWHDADGTDDEHAPDEVASPGASATETEAEAEGAAPAVSDAPLDSGDRARLAEAALTEARNTASGERMRAFGWAGERALASWDAEARWLSDKLVPHAASGEVWRWALLFAALPAAVGVLGVSPSWVPAALALILVARRMLRRAVLAGAVFSCTLLWPHFTPLIGIALPCAAALLMSHPLLAGMWSGLPMGSTLLGSLPRRWSLMMRIMLTFTGFRLLAGVPIMALVLIAVGFALGPGPAAILAAGWAVVVLSVPWLSAFRLIQRTPGGLDMSLGRALLTAASTSCVIVYGLSALLLLAGTYGAVAAGSGGPRGLVMAAAAVALWIITTAVHLVLLRHAYRRRVDLIAPA